MRGRGLLMLLCFFAGFGFWWVQHTYLDPGGGSWFGRGADRAPRAHTGQDQGAGDTAATGWQPAPPPSGEFVDVALLGSPWPVYSMAPESGNDAEYRALVQEAAAEMNLGDVLYDPALSRAAREAAYQVGLHQRPPPEAALGFLMHASGAPEYSAAQYFTHTTADDLDVIRQTVMRALAAPRSSAGHGPLRIGIGEIATPEAAYTRHISVLATRRAYQLEPAPRYVALGGMWTLSGRLPAGYQATAASVLYPDHHMETLSLEQSGEVFTVRVPAGEKPGTLYVSIEGMDGHGPGKLLQLSVEVGATEDTLPRSTRVFVPELETGFDDLTDAETYAVSLLQADRRLHDLPPLVPDPELAAVARAHSRDMRDHGFFGHLSPLTGLADDRLRAAGYRATMHSENLARNDTVGEAQAALMASIGHRKNILDPTPTHVGIGLAEAEEDGGRAWYMTQVFARKVVPLDAERTRGELFARMAAARAEHGLGAVRESARMSEVAAEHARAVAGGELDGVARRALGELRELELAMSATVHAIYNIEQFELPREALDPEVTGVGIGIEQSADDPHGRTGVVLIFAERWRRD